MVAENGRTSLTRRRLVVTLAIVVIALLVVGLIVLGGVYALGTVLFYDSYASSYHYDVSIDVDGETEDAVFLLPVGVHDDRAVLEDVYVADSDRFHGVTHEVVETERGPMVRVEVDEIRAGSDDLWIDARIESDRTVETRTPRGTEPVLSPLELSEPDPEDESGADRRPDRRNFDATSAAYVEHGGDDDVDFGFIVRYEGINEWWTFGWNWNTYETSVAGNQAPVDPAGEWVTLRGWHTEGAGSYPRFPPAPS
ncbi:hypothetical protein [Halorubrum sp. DTA98]|uniref:hypothetical protein n=1 Tax=Halorubrum sp. DTA98 TaxID=3402163 RepID=UPI003AAB6EEB